MICHLTGLQDSSSSSSMLTRSPSSSLLSRFSPVALTTVSTVSVLLLELLVRFTDRETERDMAE